MRKRKNFYYLKEIKYILDNLILKKLFLNQKCNDYGNSLIY